MGHEGLTRYELARQALDAAVAIDRSRRDPAAGLADCATLADLLDRARAEPDPGWILDLRDALGAEGRAMTLVGEVEQAIYREAGRLRRIASATPEMREEALRLCLTLHRLMLDRSSEDFSPLGLAA